VQLVLAVLWVLLGLQVLLELQVHQAQLDHLVLQDLKVDLQVQQELQELLVQLEVLALQAVLERPVLLEQLAQSE
jgi:hypothetical protein